MDSERFQRIMDLFEAALELDPEERGVYLDKASRDDPAMVQEVEEMLEADTGSERFLDSLMPEILPGDLGTDRLIGTTVGRCRIKRVISSGGMGTVYEALQEKPRRTVAVKVMKRGIASKSSLRRFEYEAQILARLRHPNIAQVFEAGTHLLSGASGGEAEQAVPYFVMEYIPDALPITEYVQRNELTVREILALFSQACEAVHCGHQKGIIHRDLKPANILVDTRGHILIIDFGVARATDSDLALTTLQTEVGQLIGTLQYMSPEQCRADPHDLDTRSDVYSLGVVLYELLCGKLPYDVRALSVYDAVQRIRDTQPPRPSTSLRVLKGDTETIVLKALEKDRERRYQSTEDLRRDIERYLNGEPIVARPPSVIYQLRTFARRNKAVVSGVLGVFITLLAGLAVSLSLYFRAEDARKKAAFEAETTKAVNDFFNEMLASIDPRQINIVSGFRLGEVAVELPPRTSGHDVSVEEMMDHAAGRVADFFEGRPELEAEVRTRIGLTYGSIGLSVKARSQLEAALQIRVEHLGEDHLDTQCSRLQLALMGRGLGPEIMAEARAHAEKAYEGMKRMFGEDHPHTLTSASILAWIQTRSACFKDTDALFRKTLEAQERVLGKEDRNTLWTRCRWAYLLVIIGRLRDAHEQIRMVLDTVDRPGSPYDENDYILVFAKMVLGGCKMFSGEYAHAEELLRYSMEQGRLILGEQHWLLCGTMWCLARSLKGEGTLKEREQLFRDALEGFVSGDGYQSLWTIRTVQALCNLLASQGRYGEIVKAYQAGWEACRSDVGLPESRRLFWLRHLTEVLVQAGRFEEGEQRCREWVDLLSEMHGEAHPETLNALAASGHLLFQAGRVQKAREYLERAIEGWQRIASSGEASVSDLSDFALLLLTCGLEDLRDPEEALALLRRADESSGGKDPSVHHIMAMAHSMSGGLDLALEIQQRIAGTGPSAQWEFDEKLLGYLLRSGETESAMRRMDEIDAWMTERRGKSPPRKFARHNIYAKLLAEEGLYALAEPMARACLAYWRDSPLGRSGKPAQISKCVLGRCLAGMGRHEEAEPLLREGFEGLKNNPVVPMDVQQESLEWLIGCYEGMGRTGEASKWRKVRPAVGLSEADESETSEQEPR